MAASSSPEPADAAPAEAPARTTLGVDSDSLVNWAMADAPHHRAVRRCREGRWSELLR